MRSIFVAGRAQKIRGPRQCRYFNAPPSSLSGVLIEYQAEVYDAIRSGRPVVALESTIITHGMPPPTNLNTAISVQNIIRSTGAIPATIALIAGKFHIGLNQSQLELISDTKATPDLIKLSRRDLAPAVALKRTGGTTIAGTMVLAHIAGIKVFATGGLGGVHRGGETSWDVSADLTELGRTPVAVVAAGAKSILDIGRTLEYLETQGVTVATYGETHDFPAFYSPTSGFKSPWRVNTPSDAASIIYAASKLNLQSGIFFGAPIPEKYAEAGALIQSAVERAIKESEENGVSRSGRDTTPWLLRRVGELTDGKAVESNIALIENTALIGGKIAVEYAKLMRDGGVAETVKSQIVYHGINVTEPTSLPRAESPREGDLPKARLLVVGATALDITAKASVTTSDTPSTFPGKVTTSLGGVARNLAEAAHRVFRSPYDTLLVSAVGKSDDVFGAVIRRKLDGLGMRTDGLVDSSTGSGVCNMLLDDQGSLIGGVADFAALDAFQASDVVNLTRSNSPNLVAIDANPSAETIGEVVKFCYRENIPTWFEPTSVDKSSRIIPAVSSIFKSLPDSDDISESRRSPITFASPNLIELARMFETARAEPWDLMTTQRWWQMIDSFELNELHSDLERLARQPLRSYSPKTEGDLSFLVNGGIAQMTVQLLPFIQHLIIKCGDKGILIAFYLTPEEARQSKWNATKTNIANHQIVINSSRGHIVVLKHFSALKASDIVNVTGAGDSLVGTLLASLVSNPSYNVFHDPTLLDIAIQKAQEAAVLTLQSPLAVSPLLSTLSS